MATWPTRADLKARLDITSTDWDTQLDNVLATAITQTKARVGEWVEGLDTPDEALAQSALERAVEIGTAEPTEGTPKSIALLYGKRRRFGTG